MSPSILSVGIQSGTEGQLDTEAGLLNAQWILTRGGGVVLLPRARGLEEADVQEEKSLTENREVKQEAGRVRSGFLARVQCLILGPAGGSVLPGPEFVRASASPRPPCTAL